MARWIVIRSGDDFVEWTDTDRNVYALLEESPDFCALLYQEMENTGTRDFVSAE